MRQFLAVLKFELNNYFKNKSFMITTILLMVLAVGGISIPGVLMGGLLGEDQTDTSETITLALWDPSGSLEDPEMFAQSMGGGIRWKVEDSQEQVKEAVRSGEAQAGFLLDDLMHYTYVVENSSMNDTLSSRFSAAAAIAYRAELLRDRGLDPMEMEALYQTQPVSDTEILGKDSVGNYAYTYLLIMVLYFLLMFYGQMIATSVTTEKSNRAIEILVTSVNSNSLIFGKVLAGAIAGLLQCVLILGSAVAAYQFFRESWGGMLDRVLDIPVQVWAAFGVFGMMGYLLYAFCFGMLGALVSKTEDISKASMPVLMIYLVSFFIAIFGLNSSDSLLMKIASFVPFTSSNAMLIRVAMGSVAWWEILLSGILLGIFCIGSGILAAKIFRFGTLMYGNPIRFSTALKKIRENN